MGNQEIIKTTVPTNNDWHTNDLEEKAEALGLNKSEFILKAVDFMVNFDTDIWKMIEKSSKGLKVDECVMMQNMFIKALAKKEAFKEVYGEYEVKFLEEFMFVNDESGYHMMTGQKLLNVLKETYANEKRVRGEWFKLTDKDLEDIKKIPIRIE